MRQNRHSRKDPLPPIKPSVSIKSRVAENRELWSAVAIQQKLLQDINTLNGKLPKQKWKDEPIPKHKHTLAQQLGLEEPPPEPLTQRQWMEVIQKSNERRDSYNPCPICKDDFGLKKQVILHCSHVFHEACLRNFEKFTNARICPLCRTDKYQKKVIDEGYKAYRVKSAIRIQSMWRGFRARKMYRKLLLENPPSTELGKKSYYAAKLELLSNKLINSMDLERKSIEKELQLMDESVKSSKSYLRSVEVELPSHHINWSAVHKEAMKREQPDCPICITPMITQPDSKTTQKKRKNTKRIVLLSCGHLFHLECMKSFEYFTQDINLRRCPVCRSEYVKKVLE